MADLPVLILSDAEQAFVSSAIDTIRPGLTGAQKLAAFRAFSRRTVRREFLALVSQAESAAALETVNAAAQARESQMGDEDDPFD